MIIIIFLAPEAPKGEEQGYQSLANPPTGYYSFTQSLLICQDTTANTFSTAFVPETCTSLFLVNAVSVPLETPDAKNDIFCRQSKYGCFHVQN